MRSPDVLEIRARELAIAAGIDPDSRVPKPGSERGMPAWCNYRELARAQRNAEKAAAASAEIANLRPQEVQYQNSPLKIFGEPDEATILQMRNCMAVGNVVGGVLCADNHLGYSQPIGGVIAYENMVSVSGTGFDIACGHAALKTDVPFGAVKDRIPTLLADINQHISFGLGRQGSARVDDALFEDDEAWKLADAEALRSLARRQLFSCGTSNHFLDLLYEVPSDPTADFDRDKQPVWIACHFGSRNLGYQSATKFLKLAGGRDGMYVPPALLDATSEVGVRYVGAMELSGRYAYLNRDLVVNKVCSILGGTAVDRVVNHHNFSFWEEHQGRKLWVVRKGATAAFPGQRGFVGGSMGDDAVIVEGIDSELSRASFYSTVHGAGRVMSRTQAKKTFTRREMDQWLHAKGVTLSGGGVDESPMSYRRLDEVIQSHAGTIKVNHRLRPFLVIMATDEHRRRDPSKD
jgi:tRNA-splicing ligase RtcB